MAYIYDDEGNYRKTVYCRWCYGKGHNSRACPERYPNGTPAQQRKAAREAEKAERKRLGIKEDRKCTFCGKTGHSRRKCEILAKDKLRLEAAIYEYRYAVAEYVKEQGLGKGTLLGAPHQQWSNDKNGWVTHQEYFMIVDLDWDSLDPHSNWGISKHASKRCEISKPVQLMSMTAHHYAMGETLTTQMLTFDSDGLDTKLTGILGDKYRQGTQRDRIAVISRAEPNIPKNYLDKQAISREAESYFKSTKTKGHYQFLTRLDSLEDAEQDASS
jgi:hypothetical protein